MTNSLQHKTAIITGASQGFGKVVAQFFIQHGANVMLCARSAAVLEETRAELATFATDGQKVVAQVCDVANPSDIASLIKATHEALGDVHILVNNAGVYGPLGTIESVNWEEWADAIAINLYGTVLACKEILPHMRQKGYGKIINLSGGGATNPLPRISAYAASKAAVVRFSESLALETQDAHIDVNCVAPGALDTRLLDQVIEAGPQVVGEKFYQRMLEIKGQGGSPMEKGAELCVFLASSDSDGITGKLISAIWDPWEDFPNHADDLATDIYTLRRIVPKERGMDWGDVK